MKNILVTPSYAPDFERCAEMLESAEAMVGDVAEHLLIVDPRDLKRFQHLASPKVRLLCKADLLPEKIWQVPLQNRWWVTEQLIPVRGWILQQIIKLAVTAQSDADAVVFVDSDVQFIRPLNLNDLWQNGKLRMFRTDMGPNQRNCPRHQNWFQFATNALNLNKSEPPGSFIAQLTTMRPDVVRQLILHLEIRFHRPWYQTLLKTWDFSEFILYGQFVQQMSANLAGHYFDDQQLCHSSWFHQLSSGQDILNFVKQTSPNHKAIHLQSNLGFDGMALKDAITKCQRA